MVGRIEKRFAERQRAYELRLDRSLQEMRGHVTTLEHHVMEVLQVQFSRLASVITETLHLPHDQATILRQLVDDHLYQLAVTTQLKLPTGRYSTFHPQTQKLADPTTGTVPPQAISRDPRIVKASGLMDNQPLFHHSNVSASCSGI